MKEPQTSKVHLNKKFSSHQEELPTQISISSPTAFIDNRSSTIAQRKIQESANQSSQVLQAKAIQKLANQPSPQIEGQVIQRNVIKEIGAAGQVGMVGENHRQYLDEDLGPMYRAAEKEASAKYKLDYKVEYEPMEVFLLDSKEAGSVKSEEKKKEKGVIQPDPVLLRLGMDLSSLLQLLAEGNVQSFYQKIKSWKDFLSKWDENALDLTIESSFIAKIRDGLLGGFKLFEGDIESNKEPIISTFFPLLKEFEKLYEMATPKELAADAKNIAKIKGMEDPVDIASTRRSMMMYRSLANWADKMKPTIFKVGGEHLDDMIEALKDK
ncbi:MAG: hypothetical protein AAFO07_24840, partial [Bacteroidota bacterium]